ncbi:hypothetical protein BDL97_09G051900 [Sphagnum fallax]|nr:hypothetical protein BDL97_09G051900 [Sphagnum fallax]
MNWITPAPQPGKYHTVPPPGSRIAVDGPPPGYTGFVPAYKNHLVGHSYGDSCRRAAAITDSFRIGKPELAIHLGGENKCEGRDFYYSQLAHPGLINEPKAVNWKASKRETPAEMKYCTGKLDIKSMRQCIGTTEKYVKETPLAMSFGDLPYKSVKLHTRREYEKYGPDTLQVIEGKHHLIGYTGHVHANQHIFSQTYGQATRRLKGNPADCYTSAAYIRFSENRPLLSNEFELKHPLHYNHLTLLQPGVGNLGPLPEGAR